MKKVLITGASGGIGLEITREFLKEGYIVWAAYCKNGEELFKLQNEQNNLNVIKIDVSNPDDIKNAKDKIKDIDVLVNNAGVSKTGLITDVSIDDWDNIFNINVRGPFLLIKEFLPCMINKKKGKIINISSMWGLVGASCEVCYSASKSALIGLTKALAKEVGPSNITVNSVAPGVIDTKMNRFLDENELSELKNETPLMKLGKPEDIALLVSFLASDKADFITGQIISSNGGFVI